MRQYMLAVHMVEGTPVPSEAETAQMYKAVDAFNAEVQSAGAWVFAGGLHPSSTATVVRAQGGQGVGRLRRAGRGPAVPGGPGGVDHAGRGCCRH